MHHALELGLIPLDCAIELGDIVAGKKTTGQNAEEITIFDSTGTAMQDTALAALAYKKAIQNNVGFSFHFFA